VTETSTEANSKRPSPRRRKQKYDPERAAEELRCSIAGLQELVRRAFEMADGEIELTELLKVLDTAGNTCSRIARLLKMDTEDSGTDPASLLSRSMDEAIEAIRKKRGWR
jgi:hypothetical protein